MKLRIQRFSGLPVSTSNLDAYNTEFKLKYDEILAAHSPDMLVVHEKLKELDAELTKKYAQIELQELPKSAKGWQKLIDSLEAPVMLAKSSEKNELLLVVMDQPLV